jgi:hypothetical protein
MSVTCSVRREGEKEEKGREGKEGGQEAHSAGAAARKEAHDSPAHTGPAWPGGAADSPRGVHCSPMYFQMFLIRDPYKIQRR